MRFILLTILILVSTVPTAERKVPFIINQKSYNDVDNSHRFPQPVHELVMIAKDNWDFDGVELSMDALINEGGCDGKQFKAFVRQLAIDLDVKGLSKLHQHDKFNLYLLIDLESSLTIDLEEDFLFDATLEVLHRLDIKSYRLSESFSKNNILGDKLDNYKKCDGVRVLYSVGPDWTQAIGEKEEKINIKLLNGVDTFVSIQSSKPLHWSAKEDGRINFGSKAFSYGVHIINRELRR